MARFHCLLATLPLFAACIAPHGWWQRDLQEWRGAPVTELLDAWGPPMRTLADEDERSVLIYERERQLDHRLEELSDPGARLRTDNMDPIYVPVDRSECTLYFEIAADEVTEIRHEGSTCDIVPRDPARRVTDPAPRRRR